MNRNRKTNQGFTLLELMIVVVIIAILAGIAYPSYLNQTRKGYRAAAQSFIMDVSGRENQMLLDNRSYRAVANTAGFQAALNVNVPPEVNPRYTLTVVVPSPATPAPSFRITATPIGSQVGDAEGTLWFDSNGTKSWK